MITVTQQCAMDTDDYRSCVQIKEGDTVIFSAIDGEPEDNTLGRNFNDCHEVMGLLEKFYQYGKEGREIEFKKEEVPWDDL